MADQDRNGGAGRLTHAQRAARRADAVRLLSEGMAVGEVAAKTGLSALYLCKLRSAVMGLLKGAQPAYAVIAALCNTGLPLQEIARSRGVSRQAVQQVYQKCLRHGVPVRRRGGEE